MQLKTQAVVLSVALMMMTAGGCGKSQDTQDAGGQMLTTQENRCPVVTETRLTAESDLLVANSVKSRITDPRVQQYLAQTLTRQYQNVMQIGQIVAKNTMSPIDSVQAATLRESAAATASSLKEKSGAELNQAYLDWQISRYEQALDTMTNRWLKMASTPDLVAFLHQLQGLLTERLATARALRASI